MIILCVYGLHSFAQVPVNGTVSVYNSKKNNNGSPEWVPGAKVSEPLSGNGDTTDSEGQFTIQFSNNLNGKTGALKVQLPRKYNGFEVANQDIINRVFIGGNDTVRVSLWTVKQKEERNQQLAQPYIDKIEKQYNEKINKLNQENSTYQDSVKFLLTKCAYEKENNQILVETLSRINPDFADERRKTALWFFEKGDLENTKNNLPNYEDIARNMENNMQDWKIWISIYKAEKNFDEVLKAYRDILKYTGTEKDRFQLLMECSGFSLKSYQYENNLIDTAFVYAIKANKLSNDLPINCKIKSFNLLGQIQRAQNQKDYYKNYQQAVKLYKQSGRKSLTDNQVRKNVAISYTLLGDYYNEKKRKEAAKTNYHTALDIYTELNKIGKIEAEAQYNVLLKLAAIYNNENKASMVQKCIIRIALLEKEDSTIAKNSQINLQRAIYYMQNKQFSEANVAYEKTLKSYEINPNLYKQEIIKTRFLIGLNQFYNEAYHEAINHFSQAYDLLLRDSKSLERTNSVRLKALSMAAMGISMKKMGNKEKGLEQYNAAKKLVKEAGLNKNDEKLLLKNMEHLKKYSSSKVVNFIVKSAGTIGGFVILFVPSML